MPLSANSGAVQRPRPQRRGRRRSLLRPGSGSGFWRSPTNCSPRRGVRDVGVNELISRSGVAKASFYRHFASKDELVLGFPGAPGPAVDRGHDRRRSPAQGRATRRSSCWRSSMSSPTGLPATTSRRARSSTSCWRWGRASARAGQHRLPREDPRHVQQLAEEAGLRDPEELLPVLAHPDEGLDRFRGRGGPRRCRPRPSNGRMADRPPPGVTEVSGGRWCAWI